ncbi:membrane-associated progesterone receptor component 1 [Daphnia magna]|uniref:Cytochrome b5 heme-binding domain-containing protein n=1 Tax=Daphnia magna TaxID=35525 RepID=A0ABQ9ZNM9_9CRUS|nr:membrane-associated progesterone receptor component 1 [Daphnia magna]KAK4014523.1 hypothetical protein OUZ56_027046 [Daphnia magna]
METKDEEVAAFISRIFNEIVSSPLNLALLGAIGYVAYKIIATQMEERKVKPEEPPLPKLRKQDMTMEQLKQYNGTGPEGRVLVAVNGKVFDVTKGKRFYGPGGPYAAFAGRDASRGLATFSVAASEEFDDLSDLTPVQKESVKEWETQFTEKYEYIGRLLRPGELSRNYSDGETEGESSEEEDVTRPKAE